MDKDKSDLDLGARSLLPLTICGTRISGSSTAIPILEIDGASAFLPSLLPREGRLSPAPPPPGSFSGQIPAQKIRAVAAISYATTALRQADLPLHVTSARFRRPLHQPRQDSPSKPAAIGRGS